MNIVIKCDTLKEVHDMLNKLEKAGIDFESVELVAGKNVEIIQIPKITPIILPEPISEPYKIRWTYRTSTTTPDSY